MESLLLSSLHAFYNQTVFNQIVAYINSSVVPDYFTALNISKRSHFSPTTTLDSVVEELFIEEFVKTFNYSSYYYQCQPQFCQYTVNDRPGALYIITSLLGFYGGLSVVLHLLIPYLVNFLLEKIVGRATLSVNQTNSNSNSKLFFFYYLVYLMEK